MIKIQEIRERIRNAVSSLEQVDHWLAELAESLPVSPHASEMWEFRIPSSFATNLYAAVQAVRSDCLQDAVASLQHAVRQNDTTLREEFFRLQRQLRSTAVVADAREFAKDGVAFEEEQTPGDEAGRKDTPSC